MNKYKRGRRLTLIGLVRELEARRYVFLENKPLHPGWSRSMTFHTLSLLAGKHGRFYKAIETNPKQEEK